MTWRILQGDVFDTLRTIAPGSIDAVVTSPPYWQLRSYLPKGHSLKRFELGSEPTPAEFVANQVRVLDLVRTALAPHGTVWLNIGDTYSSESGKRPQGKGGKQSSNAGSIREESVPGIGIDAGNLCLIPQRLMIALQDAGWLVRSVVIWSKPSPMPSSVSGWAWRRCRVKVKAQSNNNPAPMVGRYKKCTPHGGYVLRRGSWRPTSSYEPIIMLAKGDGYFGDGEPVKQKIKQATAERYQGGPMTITGQFAGSPTDKRFKDRGKKIDGSSLPSGANLRDVWSIAAEPLNEKHFAAFPTELVARCLKSSVSEKGYCRTCGAPWVRMIQSDGGDVEAHLRPKMTGGMNSGTSTLSLSGNGSAEWAERGPKTKTIGWRPSCQCPDSTPRPGRVLDPFCGSGRTGVACRRLGFDFIGCELNPEYVEMATRRIEAALRTSKRIKAAPGDSLFAETPA